MLVAEVTRFGGPEVLVVHQVPDPVAGPGGAVVAVRAADVLFVEAQVRSGWGGGYFPVRPPYVPGDGVAGQVVSVGEGVDPGWVGRRVVAYTDNAGGYAEQTVVRVDKLVAVPDGLGLSEAAALTHDGPMALTLVETVRVRPDDTVLVLGANGGAGLLVVQLAHAAGAHVIGAARGERKLDLVRKAGADDVVDPSTPDWLERVREATGGTGVDVLLDGVGGTLGTAAFDVVADGGRVFAYGAPTGGFATLDRDAAKRRGIDVFGVEQFPRARERVTTSAARALAEAAAGRLVPVLGREFPLREAAEAHAAVEARTVLGKILLVP